jgi:hypothetical protein
MSICSDRDGGGASPSSTLSSSSSALPLDRSRKRSRLDHRRTVDDDDGDKGCDDDGDYGSSINPLFVASGPRGGAISAHSAAAELEALADMVDDGVYHVLRQAWDEVAVPADTYWSSPQHLCMGSNATTTALLRGDAIAALSLPPSLPPPRIPNPRQLMASFYPARVEALAARGYQPHRGLVPVAVDRKGGKGSKMFNVLTRWGEGNSAGISHPQAAEGETRSRGSPRQRISAVAQFVEAVPCVTDRNLYVLVDEGGPVDPYFDVDFTYTAAADDGGSSSNGGDTKLSVLSAIVGTCDKATATVGVLDVEVVETALLRVLRRLRDEVQQTWSTRVEECLVLTSSLQLGRQLSAAAPRQSALEQLKLSFHVHFRLANRTAVESVTELHAFMAALRSRLQNTQHNCASSNSAEEVEAAKEATLLLSCVDFGVYTRWRAFRLPYNVKAPESHGVAKMLAGGAGDELLAEQLNKLGISLPDVHVGSAAPAVLQSVVFAADVELQRRQRYLVEKLMLSFRSLLPLLPGATRIASAKLREFLTDVTPKEVYTALTRSTTASSPFSSSAPASSDAISAWVMDMALISRDSTDFQPPGSSNLTNAASGSEGAADVFRLLQYRSGKAAELSLVQVQDLGSPFDVPMPPMPRSIRARVEDKEVKRLLAEVFWCIAPEYGPVARSAGTSWEGSETHVPSAAITPERINAQFEESIRAYYVFQKQNKFCMRLQRTHKATYAQLYLTFGSIKLRCYSNDCFDRCCIIPWEAPENPQSVPQHHAGYPKFNRLAEIHRSLFPPLPAGELVRRYGTAVLHHQPQQPL